MKKYSQISVGELLDKISILEIKSERIKDETKLSHVSRELAILSADASALESYAEWVSKIKKVNEKLWEIEDDIRAKEKSKEFDEEFVRLARAVYVTNDERFDVKDEINTFYGSDIKEQKSYEDYQ